MNATKPAPKGTPAGFTLTELLIVIAILGLLGSLLVSMAVRNSRVIKRAQCAANLQQFALATHIYASENQDKLPEMSGTVAWAWDVPAAVADAFLARGMEKKLLYCPGTAPRFNDNYNFLNQSPNSLWSFFGSNTRIIGYLLAFTGPASNPNSLALSLTNQNTTINSERIRLNTTTYLNVVPPNSQRVLLADATVSVNRLGTPDNPVPAGSFVNVPGGFSVNGTTVPHLSPHLKGTLPAGGNLAFKDGHVQWRSFAEMSQRASSGFGFWW